MHLGLADHDRRSEILAAIRSIGCATATSSSATIPTPGAAPTCPTSPWPRPCSRRARSSASWPTSPTTPTAPARETRTIWDEGLRIPPIRIVEGGRAARGRHGADPPELPPPARAAGRLPRAVRRQPPRAAAPAGSWSAATAAAPARRPWTSSWPTASGRSARRSRASPPASIASRTGWTTTASAGRRCPSRVTISVAGDRIALDFAGTGAAGAPATSTWSICPGRHGVLRAEGRARPHHSRQWRLLPRHRGHGARGSHRQRAAARAGGVADADLPAHRGCRSSARWRRRCPGGCIAATNGANSAWVFSGHEPRTGQYYVYLETLGGGSGARATKDGLDGVQVHITNTSNLPVECLEMEYPLLVEEYALVPDSGGRRAVSRRAGAPAHDACASATRRRSWGRSSVRASRPWGCWAAARAAAARSC